MTYGGEAVDDLHGVERHLHVDEYREVLRDLVRLHQLQEHLNGHQRVVGHQVGQLKQQHEKHET